LENASWRTCWKQRNGLETVTPNTLDWHVGACSSSKRKGCQLALVPDFHLTSYLFLCDYRALRDNE
ncbi:hypothetical protein F5I97DRAFT_1816405, partial [Phlebopus sp. FC_14]